MQLELSFLFYHYSHFAITIKIKQSTLGLSLFTSLDKATRCNCWFETIVGSRIEDNGIINYFLSPDTLLSLCGSLVYLILYCLILPAY